MTALVGLTSRSAADLPVSLFQRPRNFTVPE